VPVLYGGNAGSLTPDATMRLAQPPAQGAIANHDAYPLPPQAAALAQQAAALAQQIR
jgi:hypothetical protein